MGKELKTFRVSGKMKIKKTWQPFSKTVRAKNKDAAIEIVYSVLGGTHKLKRHLIKIEKVEGYE